jgi:class 3 adenylate cyclase
MSVVTFLFTDIEGSTRRWEADPDAMRTALETHNHALHDVVEAHDADACLEAIDSGLFDEVPQEDQSGLVVCTWRRISPNNGSRCAAKCLHVAATLAAISKRAWLWPCRPQARMTRRWRCHEASLPPLTPPTIRTWPATYCSATALRTAMPIPSPLMASIAAV